MNDPRFPEDIYTEPEFDPNTLANLGPLRALAGIWEGQRGIDVKPKADGPRTQVYVERTEMQPIDPQTNGPQLFYGLRYHSRMVKPNRVNAYHDQVGFWLWEPATNTVIQTLAIPRAQTAMAVGKAAPDAKTFTLKSVRGDTTYGICSTPFLEYAFRTDSYTVTVTINPDGTWRYDLDTLLMIKGKDPIHHTDTCVLTKVGEPTPNPQSLPLKPG